MLKAVPIVLIIFILLLFLAYIYIKAIIKDIKKGNKKLGLIKIGVILLVISGYRLMINYNMSNNISVPLNTDVKQYIMDVNEVKETSSGTKVKLNKVFMDINYVSFTLGVKGKEKLVAIEVKKNLEDKEPLRQIQGVWLGDRYSYSYSGFGAGYKTDKFIDPLYLVCYFSDGEEISFKIEDKNNIKEKTEIIQLNKEVDIEGRKLKIKELIKSLSSTSIHMTSDVGAFYLKAYIIQNGVSKEISGGWSGGGQHYDFEFYSHPIDESEVTLKLVPNGSDKEYFIELK